MAEIDRTVKDVVSKMTLVMENVAKNNLEDFQAHLESSLAGVVSKVGQMDELSKSMQRNYIQRLSKILETRKQAEVNFLEERKKFTSMVRDVEMAYQRKNEAYHSKLKKELVLLKSAYDKVKDENGRLLVTGEVLVAQLSASQKVCEEAVGRLKQKEEEHRDTVAEMRLEYTRLMEDVSSGTQVQGAKIVEKIEGLKVAMGGFEREKAEHEVYQDFLKEIEMLSSRIFALEKRVQEGRAGEKAGETRVDVERLVKRVGEHIDLLRELDARGNGIVGIRELVAGLGALAAKETRLERLVEETHGFMEYFNDQWNKFNLAVMEQSAAIDKIERERMITALEKLKTPRDSLYEVEISRLRFKCERLEADHAATRSLLSEMEEMLSGEGEKRFGGLGKMVRTELVHVKAMREMYEESIEKAQSDCNR